MVDIQPQFDEAGNRICIRDYIRLSFPTELVIQAWRKNSTPSLHTGFRALFSRKDFEYSQTLFLSFAVKNGLKDQCKSIKTLPPFDPPGEEEICYSRIQGYGDSIPNILEDRVLHLPHKNSSYLQGLGKIQKRLYLFILSYSQDSAISAEHLCELLHSRKSPPA